MSAFLKLFIATLLVSYAQSAAAKAACGVLEVSKGDIKIQRAGQASANPGGVGAKVCSGDTVISGVDSRAKLKMEDGNELNISPESRIAVENYQYNPAENKKKVLLNVLQGKVRATTKQENMYNDKAKDGQANTFQVKTKSAVAGVRGTDFLTGFDPRTSKTEIVTFKGRVEVGQMGPTGAIINPVQVGAGQRTESLPGQPPAPPKLIPPRDLEKANTETKADVSPGANSNNNAQSPNSANNNDAKQERKDDKQGQGQRQDDRRGNANNGNQNQGGQTGGGTPGGATGGSSPAGGTDTQARQPAALLPASGTAPLAPPPPMGGSMLDSRDLGGAVTPVVLPTASLPPPPPTIFVPPPTTTIPSVPVCQVCNEIIQTGAAKVNVRVIYPGQ